MCDCAAVFGFLFDLIQIGVNLADIATDVLILEQWLRNGETVFFVLLLVIVILSGIISSGALVVRFEHSFPSGYRPNEWWHFTLLTILLLPISPFAGVINFVGTMCFNVGDDDISESQRADWSGASPFGKPQTAQQQQHGAKQGGRQMPRLSVDGDTSDDDFQIRRVRRNGNSGNHNNGAATDAGDASKQMFERDLEAQFTALRNLDEAVLKRLGAYMLLGLSAVSESVPSAVVQLVFISVSGGQVSTLSVISLLLSLSSVGLKSWLAARSFSVPAVVFKSAAIFFDVFCLAYVFASLFNSNDLSITIVNATVNGTFGNLTVNDGTDVNLFGTDFFVTKLTFAWIVVKLITTGLLLVGFCAVVALVIHDAEGCDEIVGRPVALFFGWLLTAIPALIVQETLKLSFLVIFNSSFEPSGDQFPFAGFIHSFLYAGQESSWWPCTAVERRVTTDWLATMHALKEKMRADHDHVDAVVEAAASLREIKQPAEETTLTAAASASEATTGAEPENDDDDDCTAASRIIGKQTHAPRTSRGARRRAHRAAAAAAHMNNPSNMPMSQFLTPRAPLVADWGHVLSVLQRPCTKKVLVPDNFTTRAVWLECLAAYRDSLDTYKKSLAQHVDINLAQPVSSFRKTNPATSALRSQIDAGLQSALKIVTDTMFRSAEFLHNEAPNLDPNIFHLVMDFSCARLCERLRACSCCDDGGATRVGEVVAAVSLAGSSAICSVFGAIWPIVHAALYYQNMGLIARICFFCAVGALFVCAVLAPSFVRYNRTCRLLSNGSGAGATKFLNKDVLQAIDLFYSLPLAILQIPAPVIPDDCFAQHVLPFLTTRHVGLYGVESAGYDAMMNDYKERELDGEVNYFDDGDHIANSADKKDGRDGAAAAGSAGRANDNRSGSSTRSGEREVAQGGSPNVHIVHVGSMKTPQFSTEQ